MANSEGNAMLRPLSPTSAPPPRCPSNKGTRRKKISQVLSKVRFREVESCSDDELKAHSMSSLNGTNSSATARKGKGKCRHSPRDTQDGNTSNSHNAESLPAAWESRKKHGSTEIRARSEASQKRSSMYSPGKRSSRRSLGLLPPTLQSAREMSSKCKYTREFEPSCDHGKLDFGRSPSKQSKVVDVGRSPTKRRGKDFYRQAIRDETRSRSGETRNGGKTSDEDNMPHSERASIEAIFRTTSTFSNSEGDSISMKGLFQNLIALENEPL